MFSAGPVAVVSSASAVAAPTASSSGAAVTSPTEASLRQQHQPWGKEEVDAFIQDLVFDDADFVTEQEARQEAKPPAASNTSGGNVFVTHRPSHIGIVPSASDRASANTGGSDLSTRIASAVATNGNLATRVGRKSGTLDRKGRPSHALETQPRGESLQLCSERRPRRKVAIATLGTDGSRRFGAGSIQSYS
eukprot:TRINITY_DN49783_c0_g1_i1.p2 TRINITY_DN49783_c0_g1~~TRINITY_DN49783_c0_g1_i1.p2  ORF type:complete len:192 (+),score=28.58 TRINITY_DN49783_c0_g1_i1:61-636(+)